MWSEYRRIKHRLLILIFGWIPFGILSMVAVPGIFGTYVPCYALAIAYMVLWAYTLLQYQLYPCPNCGHSFRGRQIYLRTCPHCGIPINESTVIPNGEAKEKGNT
jgi:ribosomal protein L37AE/L43A